MKNFISQQDMKTTNICEALSYIRSKKSVTRKEIQEYMGLSWGGVSQIVSRMVSLGYVTEYKDDSIQTAGRTPSYIKINSNDNFVIGIDVNLTGISVQIINFLNDTVYKNKIKAEKKTKETFLKCIYNAIDEAFLNVQNKNVLAIGVAIQGSLINERGISVSIPIDGWRDVPIKDILEERYNVSVVVAHDPDCLLAAGVEKSIVDAVLIRLDDGIGMAVIKNGNLISGGGMLEIANTFISNGEEYKRLSAFHARRTDDDFKSFFEKLSYAILNTTVLFNTNRLILCVSDIYKENGIFEYMNSYFKKMGFDNLTIMEYDINKAAFGAGLLAIENFLKNGK